MGQTCYLCSRLLLYQRRLSDLQGWRSLSPCAYRRAVLTRERSATNGWSANRWHLPQHLVKFDRRKTVDDESRENRASREEDRLAARDCRILNHRRTLRQRHRIQGVPWLKGIVRHRYKQNLDRGLTWFRNTDSNVSASKILERN